MSPHQSQEGKPIGSAIRSATGSATGSAAAPTESTPPAVAMDARREALRHATSAANSAAQAQGLPSTDSWRRASRMDVPQSPHTVEHASRELATAATTAATAAAAATATTAVTAMPSATAATKPPTIRAPHEQLKSGGLSAIVMAQVTWRQLATASASRVVVFWTVRAETRHWRQQRQFRSVTGHGGTDVCLRVNICRGG